MKKTRSKKQNPLKTDNINSEMNLELFSKDKPYIKYILTNQKNILLGLLLLLLLIPLAVNNSSSNPLLTKTESYYHLSNSQEINFLNPNYILLYITQKIIPYESLIIIPLLLALTSFLLLHSLLKKFKFSEQFTFLFTLFLIISPTIILESSNITSNLLFFFLALLTFYLVSSEKKYYQYLAFIPLIFIPFFNTYLSITFLILFCIYTLTEYKKYPKITSKTLINIFFIVLTITLILINSSLLQQSFFSGPFYQQTKTSNLISDLGGYSGIGIFMFILALFGITITWKKPNYYLAYFLLPLTIALYFNNETIFIATILTAFFAALGFLNIFETNWEIPTLKQFTLLIIILGLSFSTISYLNRMPNLGPTNNDFNTLLWMKENIPQNSIILSSPENYEYISYFSQHQAYISLRETDNYKKQQFAKILEAKYIDELFPLLEKNNINFIYINKQLAQDQKYKYLLFLLKNERFKLVHSSQDTEIWVFK